jgi:hypothetical protein
MGHLRNCKAHKAEQPARLCELLVPARERPKEAKLVRCSGGPEAQARSNFYIIRASPRAPKKIPPNK